MNERLRELQIMVGLLFLMIPMALLIVGVGFDSEVVGETPCVDGMNRINLEGIMCEDEIYTWFGTHQAFSLLMIIPSLFGIYMISLGKKDVKGRKQE